MTFRQFMLRYVGWIQPRATDITGAVPFTPPSHWKIEWLALRVRLLSAGLRPANADFAAVRWYTCEAIPAALVNSYLRGMNGPIYASATNFAGIWLKADHSITIIRSALDDEVVRCHEMTHAQRGVGGHEAEWFNEGFGNFTGLQPEQLP